MMTPVNDFMKNAKGLAKNPLGIIALFISLIYGFACLVLSTSISNLGVNERKPLIWFIILFPILILIAFIYLVVNHHKKLYAPSDYKYESNFIKTIDESKQRERLSEEIKQIKSDIINNRNLENDNQEDLADTTDETFLKEYMMIESYAMRRIEHDFKFENLQRQAKIYTIDESEIEFDAIATTHDETYYGVEIKYSKTEELSPKFINNLTKILSDFKYNKEVKGLGFNFHLLIVIVTDSSNLEIIKNQFVKLRVSIKSDCKYKIYSTSNIKECYNLED